MANHDIQNSQHLLKRLEEEMTFLRSLMSQAEVVASNLQGTWTAVSVTYDNWKRDIKEP
ncbi:MAG: hypothetical protein JNJ47_00900 [Alphaproteobacteria bacterium]|nr:hypothetical protein [Alphaproteobacteria bacterium]